MTRRAHLAAFAGAALCAATAAGVAGAADPLQPQEWFLAAVGADRATAPGPGVPLTIVDSGLDSGQPDFTGRPATEYLDAQTTTGANEEHGTEVPSVAAAPAPTGIQSQAAAAGIAAAPCKGELRRAAAAPTLGAMSPATRTWWAWRSWRGGSVR